MSSARGAAGSGLKGRAAGDEARVTTAANPPYQCQYAEDPIACFAWDGPPPVNRQRLIGLSRLRTRVFFTGIGISSVGTPWPSSSVSATTVVSTVCGARSA